MEYPAGQGGGAPRKFRVALALDRAGPFTLTGAGFAPAPKKRSKAAARGLRRLGGLAPFHRIIGSEEQMFGDE